MTKDDALALIEAGEGQTLEFKETTGAAKEATKTLAAFASQKQGGVVIFGVKDDGTLCKAFQVSANTSERLAGSIKANTLSMTTAEPLIPKIHAFTNPDLLVVEVSPTEAEGGPYLAYSRRWRRSGASTHEVKMNYQGLAKAYNQHLYDETGENPFHIKFCPNCGGQNFSYSQSVDYAHDELYFFIRCNSCDWSDWTQ